MFTNWDILIIAVYAIHYSHSLVFSLAFSHNFQLGFCSSPQIILLTVHSWRLLFVFHQVSKMKFMLNFISTERKLFRHSTSLRCLITVISVVSLDDSLCLHLKNFCSFICVECAFGFFVFFTLHWNANQNLFKSFPRSLTCRKLNTTEILLLANRVVSGDDHCLNRLMSQYRTLQWLDSWISTSSSTMMMTNK